MSTTEQDDDAALDWGTGVEMSPFETVMWRIEADPALRTTTLMLEELDRVPDWERFVAAHAWGVQMVPRFRCRVVEPPLGLGTPRWTEDPAFDLRFHLRRQALPAGAGWTELMQSVSQFGMTPLDRTRAPWEITLYEGLPEGRALLALKMHHSMTDGKGVMQLLTQLHSRSREPRADKPRPQTSLPPSVGPVDALVTQVRQDAGAVPGLVRGAGSRALRAMADPAGSVRDGVSYGASLKRVMSPPVGEPSPLLAERSMTWRLAALDVPFSDLRAAGRAAGGSANDAYLAALLGGYRRYHEAMGVAPVEAVPTAISVSVRKPDDPAGGNHVASARFAGPMADPDPASRIRTIRQLVGSARAEPALNVIGLVSPTLARLPGPVIAGVAGPMTKGNDLQASNVPGLTEDFYIAGAQILRMYGYGPLLGGASLIAMVSHGDVGTVGINIDAAAFREEDLFLSCLVDGFAEVLSLHPGSGAPVLRG